MIWSLVKDDHLLQYRIHWFTLVVYPWYFKWLCRITSLASCLFYTLRSQMDEATYQAKCAFRASLVLPREYFFRPNTMLTWLWSSARLVWFLPVRSTSGTHLLNTCPSQATSPPHRCPSPTFQHPIMSNCFMLHTKNLFIISFFLAVLCLVCAVKKKKQYPLWLYNWCIMILMGRSEHIFLAIAPVPNYFYSQSEHL